MKLRLQSDFVDYYDGAFDNAYGSMFPRFARQSMSRRDAMMELVRMGYNVPAFGRLADLLDEPTSAEAVVIHDNVYAHCGEGKRLVLDTDAAKEDPNAFAVA